MSEPTATLYHAASSYYSMIARLSLAEAGIAYESHPVDIHRRKQQFDPDYVRLNPNMTVPTLKLPDQVLSESRDILDHALGRRESSVAWVDRQYSFAIEELTFGWFLSWNPLARKLIPRTLATTAEHLRELATKHPELASLYERRAEVFAARTKAFDASHVAGLYDERRAQATAHLDALEAALSDARATLDPAGYGPADVVWTAFLARMRFIHQGKEIEHRPHLARYTEAMFARPSFKTADVWESVSLVKLYHQMFE